MEKFYIKPVIDITHNENAALGVDADNKFGSKDVNKAVKLSDDDNYILPTAGDDLEATVVSVEPFTVNDGFSFGTINPQGKRIAKVGGATALVVGDGVVAAAQSALGTAQDNVIVQKGAGVLFVWRVVSLLGGNGAVGTLVCIERVR